MTYEFVNSRSDILPESKDIGGNRNFIYLIKVLAWAILLAAGVVLFQCQALWAQIFGAVLAALMIAHGVELQHQALHQAGFHSRAANRIIGFFLGLPMLISHSHYKDRHLHHHRYVGTPQDSEFFQYSKENNSQILWFAANLLMLPHWLRVIRLMLAAVTGQSLGIVFNSRNSVAIRTEYVIFLVIFVIMIGARLVSGSAAWTNIMLLVLLAAPIHTLIELPEHIHCDHDADIFKNTRSIQASRLVTWYTNGNNYHVEHHLAPYIIPERLHILNQKIRTKLKHHNNSYQEFIILSLKRALTKPKDEALQFGQPPDMI
jgi:fatty acid desaturase